MPKSPGPVTSAATADFAPRTEMTPTEFRLLRDAVYGGSGILVPESMAFLLERRLAPRLDVLGLGNFTDYAQYLRTGSAGREELDTAIEQVSTHETYFFREPYQLDAFTAELLPHLREALAGSRRLRLWSAGCSTGEEPYTLAMLLLESGLFTGWDVLIHATDLSRRVLGTARQGEYGPASLRSTDPVRLQRHFDPLPHGRVRVKDEVRELVSFGHVNLLEPRTREQVGTVDAVFCRNVMIYFDAPARAQLIRTLHDRLNPGGYLLLGHSENLLQASTQFELVHLSTALVYRRPLAPSGARD